MTQSLAKPEPRKRVKARQQRQAAKARKACREAVWARAESRCEWVEDGCRCNKALVPSGYVWIHIGHVDEIVPRSRGGDPHDPTNCRLMCPAHHFSGPSGAHRVTPNWRQGRV